MKTKASKWDSRPWCDPSIRDHVDYDDIAEFYNLRYYLGRRPHETFCVRIHVEMANGAFLYLCEGDWQFFVSEDIRDLYGGGTYKIQFLDGKKRFLRTLVFNIASNGFRPSRSVPGRP